MGAPSDPLYKVAFGVGRIITGELHSFCNGAIMMELRPMHAFGEGCRSAGVMHHNQRSLAKSADAPAAWI